MLDFTLYPALELFENLFKLVPEVVILFCLRELAKTKEGEAFGSETAIL